MIDIDENVVQFRDVCFDYGHTEILHNVSFEIKKSQFLAVVGPNGGGKTTLLKLILGLISPVRGTIELFGKSPELTRYKLGYVPQVLHFDNRFPVSVSDVVKMGGVHNQRLGRFSRKDTVAMRNALNMTRADHLEKKSFSELSGGERQRVLLAQALVSEPEVLLLDEPTANVDTQSEKTLFELFHTLNENRTIIMVSHNLNVVTQYASHVLCVNHTAEMHELNKVKTSSISSADGADLALILHNHSCPVHDASHKLRDKHRGEITGATV